MSPVCGAIVRDGCLVPAAVAGTFARPERLDVTVGAFMGKDARSKDSSGQVN